MLSRLKIQDRGAPWMVLASCLFAAMGYFVKLGSAHFSTAELVFYRCFLGLLGIAAVVLWRRGSLRTPVLRLHLSRSIAGTLALLLFFYAIAHLPLGTAMTLNYTSPLFLGLLTTFWLGEAMSRRLMLALAIGFAGTVLLLQPTFSRQDWLAGLLGLCSGLGAGIAYLNVRLLGEAGEPDWRTVFYFSLVASLVAGSWMVCERFSPITLQNGWMLLGMGACATLAQLAMTRAYRQGRTLKIASLAYLTVVLSTLLGAWAWGDQLSWFDVVGMILVILGGVLGSASRK